MLFFTKMPLLSRLTRHLIGWTLLLPLAAALSQFPARAAETGTIIPAPVVDMPEAPNGNLQTAVLAGGCFWGVQAVFQHVKGIEFAVSGYSGADKATAHYNDVSSGRTGHAESVKITFNPRIITYGQILRIYFSVAHDPTQLDRQGPDVGTQYRSAIFYGDDSQSAVARSYIAQLDQAHVFKQRIVTSVESLRAFYSAESYHQDYLVHHPNNPYIVFNDLPKLENLAPIPRLLSRRTQTRCGGAVTVLIPQISGGLPALAGHRGSHDRSDDMVLD